MRYIELPEKMKILIDLILEYKILVIMVMLILIFTFLLINKTIDKKKYIKLIGISFLIGLVITIVINVESLRVTLDNIINNVFTDIYFPSIEVYIFILSVMLIAIVNTFVNKDMSNAYKINNTVIFFTLVFLLISFLLTISDNSIDIFDKTSIYTNVNCLVLLQLSTTVFIVWLLISLLIYTINSIIKRLSVKEKITIEPVKVEENILPTYKDNLMDQEIVIQNDEEIINDTKIVDNNDLIVENPIIQKTDKFSLEDYKIFNQILKNMIMLNSYKDKITVSDILNPAALGMYTKKEYDIYKKILQTYID